jgi:hypothetical protein
MSELRELPVQTTNSIFALAFASELPAVGSDGEIYFVLETKSLYFWDSAAWQQIGLAPH